MRSPGSESNKSTPCWFSTIDFRQDHTGGLQLDTQDTRDLIIAQSEEMFHSEEQLLMRIINAVFLLELKFQGPMLKLCQDNGSFKLDPA